MHQRISRFADKALGGEMAVMRALMLAGGSLTPRREILSIIHSNLLYCFNFL